MVAIVDDEQKGRDKGGAKDEPTVLAASWKHDDGGINLGNKKFQEKK